MFYAKVKATAFLPQLRRLFGYKGRTVVLCEGEGAHISDYWDEGSRAYPILINPTTGNRTPDHDNQWRRLFVRQENGNPYGLSMGSLRLESGIGLAEHVFSGTRQYIRVTLHPTEDRSAWIA